MSDKHMTQTVRELKTYILEFLDLPDDDLNPIEMNLKYDLKKHILPLLNEELYVEDDDD